MKTTIEIADALLVRAKRHARREATTLRALVEEGLRLVLDVEASSTRYKLVDHSVGARGGRDPLETLTWQELREEIYGGR